MRALAVLPLIALAGAAGCGGDKPPDGRRYLDEISTARASKDAAFRTASDSPVPEGRRADLLPLAYFPADPDYAVPAILKRATDAAVMEMPTSTGTRRPMRRVGTLEFTLKGRPLKLTAFVEAASPNLNSLFVPFSDKTSGTETYAAGRYLDLHRNATGIYVVDFNLAYHPYCYFSPTYDCPYPPAENRLPLPVRAGERLPRPKASV